MINPFNIFKSKKRNIFKSETLRDKGVRYVKANYGKEYIEEFLNSYDKINRGIPIGGYVETLLFLHMIEDIKKWEG